MPMIAAIVRQSGKGQIVILEKVLNSLPYWCLADISTKYGIILQTKTKQLHVLPNKFLR
jgi:hypothetical protein